MVDSDRPMTTANAQKSSCIVEVFMRVTPSRKTAEKHIRRLEEHDPGTGVVRVIRMTEKQYDNVWYLTGGPDRQEELVGRKAAVISSAAALIIGIYDGFYGPGTGTFLIIAFTVFAKMGIAHANAQTKVINLTTNLTALAVFLLNGQVMLVLGVLAAICNMAGNYIGSGLAMKNGAALARPVILFVLGLLLLKVIGII